MKLGGGLWMAREGSFLDLLERPIAEAMDLKPSDRLSREDDFSEGYEESFEDLEFEASEDHQFREFEES
jgi:hypothetical protein